MSPHPVDTIILTMRNHRTLCLWGASVLFLVRSVKGIRPRMQLLPSSLPPHRGRKSISTTMIPVRGGGAIHLGENTPNSVRLFDVNLQRSTRNTASSRSLISSRSSSHQHHPDTVRTWAASILGLGIVCKFPATALKVGCTLAASTAAGALALVLTKPPNSGLMHKTMTWIGDHVRGHQISVVETDWMGRPSMVEKRWWGGRITYKTNHISASILKELSSANDKKKS